MGLTLDLWLLIGVLGILIILLIASWFSAQFIKLLS